VWVIVCADSLNILKLQQMRELAVMQAFIQKNAYAAYVEDAHVFIGSRLHVLEDGVLILV